MYRVERIFGKDNGIGLTERVCTLKILDATGALPPLEALSHTL